MLFYNGNVMPRTEYVSNQEIREKMKTKRTVIPCMRKSQLKYLRHITGNECWERGGDSKNTDFSKIYTVQEFLDNRDSPCPQGIRQLKDA